jgi:hypothetical protein
VSKETRKDFVLLAIISIAAAIGMISVFAASRPLAWIAIVISDAYLAFVLLLAAILSDDGLLLRGARGLPDCFLKEQPDSSS